jgi:hypothetical protein
MRIERLLFIASCAAACAAACGGSSTGGSPGTDAGGLNSSSGGSSSGAGSSSSSGSSSGGDGAATTTTTPPFPGLDAAFPGINQSCSSALDCSNGELCCSGFGMGGVTIACSPSCGGGGLQLCASSDECTGGATCAASPFGMDMYCRAPRPDAGFVRPRRDGGPQPAEDGGPIDDGAAPPDTGAE